MATKPHVEEKAKTKRYEKIREKVRRNLPPKRPDISKWKKLKN
jgi:hypothetical protein